MYPQPPPGQGPIDPRGGFAPPTPPASQPQQALPPDAYPPPPNMMPPMMPPPNMMPPPPPPNYMMPPPMYMMPPPPPPKRGGFARSIFTVLATTILGLSLTLNVYLLFASAIFGGSASHLREGTISEGDPTQK